MMKIVSLSDIVCCLKLSPKKRQLNLLPYIAFACVLKSISAHHFSRVPYLLRENFFNVQTRDSSTVRKKKHGGNQGS